MRDRLRGFMNLLQPGRVEHEPDDLGQTRNLGVGLRTGEIRMLRTLEDREHARVERSLDVVGGTVANENGLRGTDPEQAEGVEEDRRMRLGPGF